MPNKAAPEGLTLGEVLQPIPALNVAMEIDRADPDFPSREIDYNQQTDNGLASLRSKTNIRSHEQIAASTSGDLPIGLGLSLRAPMAGQAENNQFPCRTNNYGKQRN